MIFDADLDKHAIERWLENHLPVLEDYVFLALENAGILVDPAANDQQTAFAR